MKHCAALLAVLAFLAACGGDEPAAHDAVGGALWFVTATTLVSVTGRVRGDARAVAARLRPV